MLREQILEDIKSAMKSGDTFKRDALRMVNAALKQVEVDERIKLSDERVISILQKEIKSRVDSVEAYKKGGRDDLVKKEQGEIELIKTYLPAELSDDELKEYYDNNKEVVKKPKSYRASHILVDDEESAKNILNEINDGLSFEDAANKYSKDNGSKNGDLGEFPKGTMVKEFEEALDKLGEGEISKPVKTQFGYHIIKLDHTHDEYLPEFDEIKDRIHDTLLMIKRQEKYLEKTRKIKEKVEVKKYY